MHELTVVVFYLFHLFKVLVLCTYYLKELFGQTMAISRILAHISALQYTVNSRRAKKKLRSSSRWDHLYSK